MQRGVDAQKRLACHMCIGHSTKAILVFSGMYEYFCIFGLSKVIDECVHPSIKQEVGKITVKSVYKPMMRTYGTTDERIRNVSRYPNSHWRY